MALLDSIVSALRLGDTSAKTLTPEINRNIKTARAELIRSGVSEVIAESEHPLIEEAIVTYALMKMGRESLYDRYKESWEYQVDCIRKSSLVCESAGETVEENENV